ncbi:hypothetical protein [Clostridium estertheticum]|uniref:hypothetical protein n=1 Tax=Clostridium estertheticum TaxID=238834 RepID=UPI001CF4A8DC|nr:hypothetical protein [Clostridium estertheticum]MCB2340872.1 hypothetical protein [Clostridium estertheticum]
MNFEKDLREQISQLLKEDKVGFNEQDSMCRLLISYLQLLNRGIPIKKRKVFISDNIEKIIKGSKLDEIYINALLKFKCNFEDGIDMKCHLSTNIFYSYISVSKKNKKYSKSRDYLLDDWGIYHLHLRDKDVKNKCEMYSDKNDEETGNRSQYLLFVKVTDNEVYFIDILNHNEKNVFAKQELVETLDRNWHSLLEEYNIPNLLSVSKLTDKEVNNARQNGKYILYNINKKVYIPMGGGLTSVGTNIMHTEKAEEILDDIEIIEADIKNRFEEIRKQIQKQEKNYDKRLKLKLQLSTNGYLITEINTNYKMLYHIEGNKLGIYYDGFSVIY